MCVHVCGLCVCVSVCVLNIEWIFQAGKVWYEVCNVNVEMLAFLHLLLLAVVTAIAYGKNMEMND